MAKDKFNPEQGEEGIPDNPVPSDGKQAEGQGASEDAQAAAGDPAADPLAEAERILRDAPDGAEEIQQAHEAPAGQEGTQPDPLAADAPETAEDPELREVGLDEASGGVETEPAERIEAAEEVLEESGYSRESELEEDLRRVTAEYQNYRRRVERDRAAEKDRVKGQLITELMPVLDDISGARQAGELQDGPFAHIAERLETVLAQQGLERVGEVAMAFDPNEHEAIMQQPSEDVEADHIAVVVRSGYRLGERLLRAAQVIVSSGRTE
ncbi:nucleotide exchange factor GrpE [Nesterenkonia populi]